MSEKRNVFLSIGQQHQPKYREFKQELERILNENDLVVYELPGRSFDDPLAEVQQMLSVCDGAIIVCFQRVYGASAKEFRTDADPLNVKPLNLTTVWNHMEGAMAKGSGLPVLVLAEPGCRDEGVLNSRVKLDVVRMELDLDGLSSGDFPSMLKGWKRQILARSAKVAPDIGSQLDGLKETPVLDVVRALRFRHWALLVTYTAAVFGAGAWLSSFLSKGIAS